MAFIKKDWKCGDTITADDLNRLENGVEEALDGGSVDCGYSCSEGWTTLTEESVTTKTEEDIPYAYGAFVYSEPITADTIKVTFNGTEYTCNKQIHELGFTYYGTNVMVPSGETIDWTQYPFAIVSLDDERNFLDTETAGTYSVKIETFGDIIETSECFEKARGYSCIESVTTYADETVAFV